MFEAKRALLVGCHPDDVECGLGATVISNLNHCDLYYACLSSSSDILGNENIITERDEAVKLMGAKPLFGEHRTMYFRSEVDVVCQSLYHVREVVKPDVVFLPSIHDVHQDHRVVAEEGFRVFRDVPLVLAYETPRSTLEFKPNLWVPLTAEAVDFKIKLVQTYKSQSRKVYMQPTFIRSHLTFRGGQYDVSYAEAFEVVRWRL